MNEIKLRLRTKEEKCAFMDGFEECARFLEKYTSEEGNEKVKYIIKMVNVALAFKEKEENDEP